MQKQSSRYTKEQETALVEGYSGCQTQEDRQEFIDEWALENNKTKRMVIAKLTKLGLYQAEKRLSKLTGKPAETKFQMVTRIEQMYGIPGLTGLEKAPKSTLLKLLKE